MIALVSNLPTITNPARILEFYTKNRVANGRRMREILEILNVSDDSFTLSELQSRLPHYELAPELVKELNCRGHKLPPDGFIPAFSLHNWCEENRLDLIDKAVDPRKIPELIHSRGYRILEVEVPEEIRGFLDKKTAIKEEDFFELLDLATFHLETPLRIRVTTRDR